MIKKAYNINKLLAPARLSASVSMFIEWSIFALLLKQTHCNLITSPDIHGTFFCHCLLLFSLESIWATLHEPVSSERGVCSENPGVLFLKRLPYRLFDRVFAASLCQLYDNFMCANGCLFYRRPFVMVKRSSEVSGRDTKLKADWLKLGQALHFECIYSFREKISRGIKHVIYKSLECVQLIVFKLLQTYWSVQK